MFNNSPWGELNPNFMVSNNLAAFVAFEQSEHRDVLGGRQKKS
jgi:hypothetical protein